MMLFNGFLNELGPNVLKTFRMAVRRWFALRKRERVGDVWPIKPGSERKPDGWPGWPEENQFAFVLTHDVSTQAGLDRVRQLAELEMSLGFRSCFNFFPEGPYSVPPELISWLVERGFEIGVRDWKRDGKPYKSREEFRKKRESIKHNLKEWNASGFRSGLMGNNLDWLRDMEVQYDASTFDTDPFESKHGEVGTIFPFWVPGRSKGTGFVELPYTLAQDSTLFLLLNAVSPVAWKQKLDWIAENEGMALLNVHPDLIYFVGQHRRKDGVFPSSLYREFLQYVRDRFSGKYWQALPREVAAYVRPIGPRLALPEAVKPNIDVGKVPEVKVWIDLDNTPHVPFFIPIIRELERRGHRVILTARDAFQVCELADQKGLHYVQIGRHHGKNRFMKVIGLVWRSMQLTSFCLWHKPDIALSHGARAQMMLCNILGIPTVLIMDYEHIRTPLLMAPKWEIVPDSLPDHGLHSSSVRLRKFRGIKEDVYTPEFKPDPLLLAGLGLRSEDLVITVRPPANEAHYHNPESELLLKGLMKRICQTPGVRAVLLPRNKNQEQALRASNPGWFANGVTTVPQRAIDGLSLLWFSDLVVSGGGTMNREAAALGIPVYSIFRGKVGAVDAKLEKDGRLIMVRSADEVIEKIMFDRRVKTSAPDRRPRAALADIVDHVEEIIRIECRRQF